MGTERENQIPGDRRNHLLIRYGTGRMGLFGSAPSGKANESSSKQEREQHTDTA